MRKIKRNSQIDWAVWHLVEHLILASAIGVLAWILTKSCLLGLAVGILNISLDFDHLLEYLFWSKGEFVLEDFLTGKFFEGKETVWVIFHAWEYALLGIPFYLLTKNMVWVIFSISISLHLLFDQFIYKKDSKFYFLTYRILKKFDKRRL